MDKKGRPRPDGYKMEVYPPEAAIVLRIFCQFADGWALTRIVKSLNEEGVPGQIRATKGWSPSTITRMLRNEKYAGRWVWNRMETRRDPKTGRRRKLPKPESDWIVREDESLRIVAPPLWARVQQRLSEVAKVWPGSTGKRGFEAAGGGGRVKVYPRQLLSGAMTCGMCGNSITQVSGKAGGYYGCLAATKRGCENRLLVRRTLVERVILAAMRDELMSSENLRYVLQRVEKEVARTYADVPETVRLRNAELSTLERKIANFVEYIGEGPELSPRLSRQPKRRLRACARRSWGWIEAGRLSSKSRRRPGSKSAWRRFRRSWNEGREGRSGATKTARADSAGAGEATGRTLLLPGRVDPRCAGRARREP